MYYEREFDSAIGVMRGVALGFAIWIVIVSECLRFL
jgi:hypothetical protein